MTNCFKNYFGQKIRLITIKIHCFVVEFIGKHYMLVRLKKNLYYPTKVIRTILDQRPLQLIENRLNSYNFKSKMRTTEVVAENSILTYVFLFSIRNQCSFKSNIITFLFLNCHFLFIAHVQTP